MEKDEKGGLLGEHLGQAQLQALVDSRAGEWIRCEAAEHIAGCDECLEQYLALLETEPLLEPAGSPAAAAAAVMERRRNRRRGARNFATVLAAACLAMVIWGCGMMHTVNHLAALPGEPQKPGLFQRMDEAADCVADAFNGFFAGLGAARVK